MVLFPGSTSCCGFDAADSVEIDISASDAYGYIQVDRGTSWEAATRYKTTVLAWKTPGATLSLSPVAAPTYDASPFSYYCWTNQKKPVFNIFGDMIDSEDFGCGNYFKTSLFSSFRFTAGVQYRPYTTTAANMFLTIATSGPRIFSKSGPSVVTPLSQSDVLSASYSGLGSGGWQVELASNHYGTNHNITDRQVQELCNCSGRSRSLYLSPSGSDIRRPKGNVPLSLTSCNTPIQLQESHAVSGYPTVVGTTLTASDGGQMFYQLDYLLTVSSVRAVFESSEMPLLDGLAAGSC